jgi:hypothetical protein
MAEVFVVTGPAVYLQFSSQPCSGDASYLDHRGVVGSCAFCMLQSNDGPFCELFFQVSKYTFQLCVGLSPLRSFGAGGFVFEIPQERMQNHF